MITPLTIIGSFLLYRKLSIEYIIYVYNTAMDKSKIDPYLQTLSRYYGQVADANSIGATFHV